MLFYLKRSVLTFLFFLLSISFQLHAESSQHIVLERISQLKLQNSQLSSLQVEPLADLKLLNALKHSFIMKQDALSLKLKLARSEYTQFFNRQQQANKKLIGINNQELYNTLQEIIKYNADMSHHSLAEIQWLEKNSVLVKNLINQYDIKIKQNNLSQLRLERKIEADKLKLRIQELRKLNYDFLKNKAEITAKSSEDPQVFYLRKQGEDSLDDFMLSIRRIEIEQLQLFVKLNFSDYLRMRSGTLVTLDKLISRLKELALRAMSSISILNTISTSQSKLKAFWKDSTLSAKTLKPLYLRLSSQENDIKELSQKYEVLISSIQKHSGVYEKDRLTILKSRKGLLKDSVNLGRQIHNEFIKLPQAAFNYIYGLNERVFEYFKSLIPWQQMAAILFLLAMGLVWLVGKNHKSSFLVKDKIYDSEHHFYSILAYLIARNWSALCLLAIVCSVFTCAKIPPISYQLILVVFVVWFVFRIIISMTRLALLETVSNVAGLDVRLYHRLRFTFVLGGIITVATVLSHYLHMHYLVLELLDRLFMFFLFTVSIVLLRGHKILLILLHNYLNPQKFYTKRALDLFTLLVPFALLVNGALGMFSYVTLAWEFSYYQAIIVLAVISYVILRGILLDFLDKISQKMIKDFNNGWLWTEALLKPLYNILLYLTLILLAMMVFRLYGWDHQSPVVKGLHDIWELNLVTVSRISITTKSSVFFIVLVMCLIWLARWSREFCYRWLYNNVVDQGVRNSLSIFTQYAMVIIGSILALTVLGIDISGISMIIGGLAVGVGFGLRDFANNIVGGLVLLIERPVKEGDLISFGDLEGKVTHIGLRSMRIKSWDNYEVVLPNADLFIKPFTNWTYKDTVVRTVVAIKVNRYDSPLKVQSLVLDVLNIIPEVLETPTPQVFLKHIDDALIELEVRYYINVEIHSRVEVRSNVLFAIMAQFKAAGIKSPIKPIQVEYIENAIS